MIPAIKTQNGITLMLNGNTNVIANDHPNFDKICDAIKSDASVDDILSLVDIAIAVADFGEGKVTVENGVVMYNGTGLHHSMTNRILDMMREGFNVAPMLLFLENLMDNPDFRAVNELYGFLEATDLPITEDGHFLAYKMVREDWTDHRTGKMDNSIGAVVEMARNQVNNDKEQTCSAGLHFCSQGYLGFYGHGGRTVILKINPRDVVSIPSDYNNAKGRACRYQVVDEVAGYEGTQVPEDHSLGTSVADSYYDDDWESGDEVSMEEAADLLCGHTDDPKAALRKRIARGSVKTVTDTWSGKENVILP